jgi:hypothetical protein
VLLALIFTGFQCVEYSFSSFTIADGIFGSSFFFGTGYPYMFFQSRCAINNYYSSAQASIFLEYIYYFSNPLDINNTLFAINKITRNIPKKFSRSMSQCEFL